MITVGIDPSINSTGVCVRKDDTYEYYIITGKLTKKQQAFSHDRIKLLNYNKKQQKDLDYHTKEYQKSENIFNIITQIRHILEQYDNVEVIMEGISYGSVGSAAIADLAGLNFAIRMMLIDMNICFKIVSPISLKIFATNNAGATKDEIIWAWKLLDPEIKGVSDIKIDDLADSYFLSRYN